MQRVRDQLVLEGIASIASNGIQVGLEQLTVAALASAAGVAPADAIAMWAEDGDSAVADERLREAVAVAILREQPGIGDMGMGGGGLTETLVAVSAILESMPPLEDLNPAERGSYFRRAVLAGTNTNHDMADRSQLWQSYVAISAGLLSQPKVSPAMAAAWRHGEENGAQRYVNMYTLIAQMFGFRLRYCYTWQQFATAVSALSEGLMIRSNVSPHVRSVERLTGDNGSQETWTLFGVAFEGLVRQFFESDDTPIDTAIDHEPGPPEPDET